jgi:hypothetical protein
LWLAISRYNFFRNFGNFFRNRWVSYGGLLRDETVLSGDVSHGDDANTNEMSLMVWQRRKKLNLFGNVGKSITKYSHDGKCTLVDDPLCISIVKLLKNTYELQKQIFHEHWARQIMNLTICNN